jgi:hypothetical protein
MGDVVRLGDRREVFFSKKDWLAVTLKRDSIGSRA